MHQQLELSKERLLKEKILEDRLDLMIRDQAEEVWKQRENQWAEERRASQKLLDECLKSQREQIVEKHQKNLEQKAVLVAEQEKLLEEIEKFKNETQRQREKRNDEKTARREEIENEIEEAKELKLMIKKEEELEDAQRENLTTGLKQAIAEEKMNILKSPFTNKIHSRPSTANSVRFINVPDEKEDNQTRPTTANSTFSRLTGPFIY